MKATGKVRPPHSAIRFSWMSRFRIGHCQKLSRRSDAQFSAAIAALATGKWQGPVRSTYGWHVVKVATRKEARVPTLVEVREKVRKDFAQEQRRKTNLEVFERLKSRHVIVVQGREAQSLCRGRR